MQWGQPQMHIEVENGEDLLVWLAHRYTQTITHDALAAEYRAILKVAYELHRRTHVQGPDIEPVWPKPDDLHDDLPQDAIGIDEALNRSDLQDIKVEDDGRRTTVTGRFATEPAVQNINPKTPEGEAIKQAARDALLVGEPDRYFRDGGQLPLHDRMKIDAKVLRDARSNSVTFPSLWRTSHGWWSQRNPQADISGPWNNRKAASLANDCRYAEAHVINQEEDEGL